MTSTQIIIFIIGILFCNSILLSYTLFEEKRTNKELQKKVENLSSIILTIVNLDCDELIEGGTVE